jgi:cobalamin-dependent methionine synthase I
LTRPLLIAQNLNSSDPAVHAALAAGDAAWVRQCARRIESSGVDLIDCNAGTFGPSEVSILEWMVEQVAAMVRLPLSIDSAETSVLEAVASRLTRPILLNSLPVDFEPSPGLRRLLSQARCQAVLSLRRAGELPPDSRTRIEWAREGLRRIEAAGGDASRVLVDAIALPFGDDVEAGQPLLEFVRSWAHSGEPAGTLVGLGNIGYGHPDAVRIQREWMRRLRNAGISAALVDAFEPGLLSDLSPDH